MKTAHLNILSQKYTENFGFKKVIFFLTAIFLKAIFLTATFLRPIFLTAIFLTLILTEFLPRPPLSSPF